MAFIGLEELLRFLDNRNLFLIGQQTFYFIYPIKALSAGLAIWYFWSRYTEIKLNDLSRASHTGLSIAVGLTVMIVWVNLDQSFATLGEPEGFNISVFENNILKASMIFFRMAGAVIVVPVMEEIFWRSFLLRFIIKNEFTSIPIGCFTWMSFLITIVLFGLEHNYYIAGIMAGIAYNLLLYRTKSIAQCILSHAVTNCALGIYVLSTGHWNFW
jgi:CAAX prenyl protease-like protein